MAKSTLGTGNLIRELNHMNPAAKHLRLGDYLEALVANQNAILVNQASILAKLDAVGAAGASSAAIAAAAGTTNRSGATASTALIQPSAV